MGNPNIIFNVQRVFRYKIIIEYIGTNLSGWQRQGNSLSVQEILERAINKFSHMQVMLCAAGRTDAGVHATGQVAHFDLDKQFEQHKIIAAINHFTKPYLIGVKECSLVDESFHARFNAVQRHYLYRIINRTAKIVIDQDRAWWIKQPLDVIAMQQATPYLIGKHDFSSFRAKYCQAKSPVKTLSKIEIIQENEEIKFYLSAPSFLHHMVRNIIGTLVQIGLKQYPVEHIKSVLESKNRDNAGITAPACGLYFTRVDY